MKFNVCLVKLESKIKKIVKLNGQEIPKSKCLTISWINNLLRWRGENGCKSYNKSIMDEVQKLGGVHWLVQPVLGEFFWLHRPSRFSQITHCHCTGSESRAFHYRSLFS